MRTSTIEFRTEDSHDFHYVTREFFLKGRLLTFVDNNYLDTFEFTDSNSCLRGFSLSHPHKRR